jgi:hypothetical protein
MQSGRSRIWLQKCICFPAFHFFLIVLGFEFRASHLLDKCSNTTAMHPALFAFVILGIGSNVYVQASLDHYPIYASHIAEMTDMCHHAQLSIELRSDEYSA